MFTLNGGVICWRSVKQTCVADSTTEAEYVATSEVAKEAVWLKKFLLDLQVNQVQIDTLPFIVIIVGL